MESRSGVAANVIATGAVSVDPATRRLGDCRKDRCVSTPAVVDIPARSRAAGIAIVDHRGDRGEGGVDRSGWRGNGQSSADAVIQTRPPAMFSVTRREGGINWKFDPGRSARPVEMGQRGPVCGQEVATSRQTDRASRRLC